jgi:hypothetical protein
MLTLSGLTSDPDPPTCTSWVAGITGFDHHTQFVFETASDFCQASLKLQPSCLYLLNTSITDGAL